VIVLARPDRMSGANVALDLKLAGDGMSLKKNG
jgi:hypothetical protein